MGLAICVGYLADMKQHDEEGAEWAEQMFAAANKYLAAQGLPGWSEPETLPAELGMRPHVGSFPYSFLHYLRRAYAYAVEYPDSELAPTGGELSREDDSVIDDAMSMLSSHLLCHSDAEGLYVPVDFDEPLFADPEDEVPGGGMLGSSQGLLAELRLVAPAIGIALTDGELGDDEAARLFEAAQDDAHPWCREYCVFGALWEAARVSIEHHTAIVFS